MPQDLFSQTLPASRIVKFMQFPLLRIVIAAAFLIPVLVLNKVIQTALLHKLSGSTLVWARYIEAAMFFMLLLWAFELYAKFVEKRPAWEFFGEQWLAEMASGFLLALLLAGTVVAILMFTRCLTVTGMIANKRLALDLFFKFFMGAFLEELFFRLIVFKLSEELLGTWIALAIQALFFGFAHGANEHATGFTSLAVAVIGGLLYTAAYIHARSLWLPLGLHWGWNFFQSGIFSMANSGTPYAGLLVTKVSGPAWLTGGDFGIDASWLAIFLCLAAGTMLLGLAQRNEHVVAPAWKRKKTPQ